MTVSIALFKAIGELQRKRLRQSRAAVFSWNPRTRGQFLQAKSWVPSSILRHHPHRAWSVTGIFCMEEVSIPCGGWCNGADFMGISKFPEILGELSMFKQCVSGSFFSAHALEPGNEATTLTDWVKLPNQRRSKKTGDGAERDRARRAAETADHRSERLRNWGWGTVPNTLL